MPENQPRRKRSPEDRAQLAEKILAGMRSGLSCFKACQAVGVPHSTFMDWLDADPELADRYAGAREDLVEKIASEILDIADKDVDIQDGKKDWAAVQKHELQVDTRKWLLSKLAPKRYGDKIETTHQIGESFDKIVRQIVKA